MQFSLFDEKKFGINRLWSGAAKVFDYIRRSVRGGALRPVRRIGLRFARHWPYPVPIVIDGRRFYVDLRSGIGRAVFVLQEFDPAVQESIVANLSSGSTFLDIGANIGWYSFLGANLVGPLGQVHAFEVDLRPLRCLRRTVAANPDLPIQLHEFGIGDYARKVSIKRSQESGHTKIEYGETGDHKIIIRTLDSFHHHHAFPHVDLVKIDVEGADLLVLKGARSLLNDHKPNVICEISERLLADFECSLSDVYRFFESIDYSYSYVSGAWTPTIVARPINVSNHASKRSKATSKALAKARADARAE